MFQASEARMSIYIASDYIAAQVKKIRPLSDMVVADYQVNSTHSRSDRNAAMFEPRWYTTRIDCRQKFGRSASSDCAVSSKATRTDLFRA